MRANQPRLHAFDESESPAATSASHSRTPRGLRRREHDSDPCSDIKECDAARKPWGSRSSPRLAMENDLRNAAIGGLEKARRGRLPRPALERARCPPPLPRQFPRGAGVGRCSFRSRCWPAAWRRVDRLLVLRRRACRGGDDRVARRATAGRAHPRLRIPVDRRLSVPHRGALRSARASNSQARRRCVLKLRIRAGRRAGL